MRPTAKLTSHSAKITVTSEILNYLVPLTEEQKSQLERNLIEEGCRDPLIVWPGPNGKLILIDGHNRLKICEKHNIPYKIKEIEFRDIDDAKQWMVDNQIGRRNLTPDQLSYYRGIKYLSIKKVKGGYKNVLSKGKNEIATSERLGREFDISESTVKRDAKFAEGLNIIGRTNLKLKMRILLGEADVKKADVQILSSAPNPEKITIKNEADLFNKAKTIKGEILNKIEQEVKDLEKSKVEKSREILRQSEPVFSSKEDRIRKIKGMIISAINRAISEKDSSAIKELKKLIDKLEDLLFE